MGKLVIFVILFFSVLSACATGVKYTYEEIKDYPEPIQKSIKKGEVVMGMTPAQVRYVWGNPDKTSATYEGGKHREIWVYTDILGLSTKAYLYFEDGKLVFSAK